MDVTDRRVQNLLGDYLAVERIDTVNRACKEVVPRVTVYTKYIKRMLDVLFSFIALVVTLPVNIILGIATLIVLGRPIFFKQKRIGKDGKPFTIVKFRNMTNACDENGELLPPQQRLTKFGNFVRKTSLDELLNFWSIFKGDMSFIGPRALPEVYLPRYSKRHYMRLKVRPGLECPPWVISNKPRTWHEQFENDVWYVEHVSFAVDCAMLFRLVYFTFNRKNAKMRAECQKGSFIGYSWEGRAISNYDVDEDTINKALSSQPGT